MRIILSLFIKIVNIAEKAAVVIYRAQERRTRIRTKSGIFKEER
jgi:hypothetical protein